MYALGVSDCVCVCVCYLSLSLSLALALRYVVVLFARSLPFCSSSTVQVLTAQPCPPTYFAHVASSPSRVGVCRIVCTGSCQVAARARSAGLVSAPSHLCARCSVCVRVCVYVHIYICICVCECVCVCVCVCVRVLWARSDYMLHVH